MDIHIDTRSLLLALMINVLTTALVLHTVMSRDTLAARRALQGAALQALGWLALLGSTLVRGTWGDHLLSTVSMGALAASLACLGQAFDWWCGRTKASRLPWVLAVITPLGYAAGFGHYGFRVGWANGLLAFQMLWLAAAMARPPAQPVGRWRWLIVVCMAAQACVTAWRGVLGAFFPEAYPTFLAPHPVNIAAALAAQATALLVVMALLLAYRDEAARELQRLATVDGLTGLLNRRAWIERAREVFAVSLRYQQPMAVLMIDLDHFKHINDTHGHQMGDQALTCCARELMAVLRSGDLAGRYGGEEFCVLLQHADERAALAFDRRLRARLADAGRTELGFEVSYSAGMVQLQDHVESLEALLHDADVALYRAKAMGRGCTVGALDSPDAAQRASQHL